MDIRFISTKVHGILDYIMGATLISVPFLLGLSNKKAESVIPVSLGCSAIAYSLITDYELGVARGISMKTHLGIDLVSGLLLTASPFLFKFRNKVSIPHIVLGVTEVLAALCTKQNARSNKGPVLKEYLPERILEKTDRRKVLVA